MSIDMAQFHQVFFEESFEGLDIMESGLLNLSPGEPDSEAINSIFRAAHSIKGGSGTFGFTEISDFTHVMETLMDEMRDGRRQITQTAVNLLLGSVDCLREMLFAVKDGQAIDAERVAEHKHALDLEQQKSGSGQQDESLSAHEPFSSQARQSDSKVIGWHIAFSPHADLLKTGNDPVRMFRELSVLGELDVTADFRGVPDFYQLDPEECHLSWNLVLKGDIDRAPIDEAFAWVEDDCDLAIQPLYQADDLSLLVADAENQISVNRAQNPAAEHVVQAGISKPDESSTPVIKEKAPGDEAKNKGSTSIRVDTSKIDTLINMVGELVITQSMLSLIGEHFDMSKQDQLKNGLAQLERHTRELQESVMNIRMMPINSVFSRFSRLVHDLSNKLGKKIDLKLIGEHTEVDKTVVELISDPLVHLVRNSLDHGIEMPDERLAVGKPETGTVSLEAYHRGGNIVIEVSDDGKGLDKDRLRAKAIEKGLLDEDAILTDKQTFELIFMPGFSTAEKLTDISGRGVGMDVVRRNIQALGGNIEIISELGKGSTISIHLPLTLAILDGQSIAVGDETYIVPLGSIIESLHIKEERINRVADKGETFLLRSEYLPIIRMHEIFKVPNVKTTKLSEGLLVVVEGQGVRCGLFVDDLLGQQQVVIKSLEANYRRIEGVSGATILGDGSVALILDIPGLVRLANQ
ncbi:chemotaxis protein CheA [Methylicorpusculum sp.]|uniref:chemotaxis protein CheA n=3 Tax=Methylicorpusculum sp. TaxID=2713644 RepID=UPI0027315B61|nr:chemotaxis protein CheA [Methylicorpusculum sp.]MDP2177972.1 chemotaxis protein CheA [Methylicorpusculum sp.]MDP3528121.1 chemotaxis protein CheA [Methylicorpusculum sp.]